jgi:hypothetical protein
MFQWNPLIIGEVMFFWNKYSTTKHQFKLPGRKSSHSKAVTRDLNATTLKRVTSHILQPMKDHMAYLLYLNSFRGKITLKRWICLTGKIDLFFTLEIVQALVKYIMKMWSYHCKTTMLTFFFSKFKPTNSLAHCTEGLEIFCHSLIKLLVQSRNGSKSGPVITISFPVKYILYAISPHYPIT